MPLPEAKSVLLRGQWDDDSGGCDLHPFWFRRNPRFVLRPHVRTAFTLTLTLPGRWRRGASLDRMIGFYVLAASDAEGTVAAPGKAICAEATFVPLASTSLRCELAPTAATPTYVVVPCTYGPGVACAFRLSISAAAGSFDVHQVAGLESAGTGLGMSALLSLVAED